MKSIQNKIYWILQIIGWSFPAINSWAKILIETPLKPTYIFFEGLIILLSGIIASSWLRSFIKKNIDFEKLASKTFIKISLAYIAAALLYFSQMMILTFIAYNSLHDKSIEITTIILISSFVNSFIFMLFWLVFYISIKAIIRLRLAKAKQFALQSSLNEGQLNTLKGQINPHFMFNSLNNIRALILEDKYKARDMITRLSEMLRYSLANHSVNKIKLSEELEMVENYLALSKIQLEERLEHSIEIDKQLLTIEIPPMIIQMLVENAVKHGISNQQNGGTISLTIQKNENMLDILVSNNGQLVKTSQSTQLGLKNIKKRLQLIYTESASFNLFEKGNFVHAKITIPLK